MAHFRQRERHVGFEYSKLLSWDLTLIVRTLICRNGRKTCSTVNDCHFWRLSLDPRSSSYFLMSNKDVVHGDARVGSC